MFTRIYRMTQSMWSNKNGTKYELQTNLSTFQFKNPDEWNLLILTTHKNYPNVLNIKLQSKELSTEQLKSSLAITWPAHECTSEIVEENLRKQLSTERCELASKQKGYKTKDSTKLAILRMHFKEELSINQISNTLFIPYSTVSRVIREFNDNPKISNNWFEARVMKACESKAIKLAIENYVQNSCNVFNSNDMPDIFNRVLMWHCKREALSSF